MTISKVEPAQPLTAGFVSNHTRMVTVVEYTSLRKCVKCHELKEASEFYPRPGGRYLTAECKECMKKRSRNRVPVDRKVSTVPSETDVIAELHKQGIPALPGKALGQQWADVIAYGAVLIEVKSAKRHYRGSYNFGFTPSQRAGKLRGDLVVLVCKHDDGNTFHVFYANNPVFYGDDGKLKTGIAWTPNAKHKGRFISLTDEMMYHAQDNWDLVEDHLTKICARLTMGYQLPIRLIAA